MSEKLNTENPVFAKNTLEFVTIAKSFCDFLAQIDQMDKKTFLDTMVKILPLLYLKATLLPDNEIEGDEDPEAFASETQYAVLSDKIAKLLGEDDTYLEVFHPDMAYSDEAIASNISENITDIWQDIYNFVEVYRQGSEESMNDALYYCRSNFGTYWGQSLVNVMRALHAIIYSESMEDDSI